MAAASATPSVHLVLKQHSNMADSKEGCESQHPTCSSSSSSRRSSSGDVANDSVASEITSQNFKTGDKSNLPDVWDGKHFLGLIGRNGNEMRFINTPASILNGVPCCNSSVNNRSDAVARCFEGASYMQTQQGSSQGCGYNVSSTSCPPADILLSNELEQKPTKGGSIVGGDCCGIGGNVAIGLGGIVGRCNSHYMLNGSGSVGGIFGNLWPDRLHSTSLNSNSTPSYGGGIGISPYNIWNTGTANAFPNSTHLLSTLVAGQAINNGASTGNVGAVSAESDSLLELRSKLLGGTVNAKKSLIKRHIMIYHCKFGEFGVAEGQFTEPSGVAVNAQNYIIVADTNNHRIQIFDKEGRFKFQFGECGKRDSQLLYPNRVAVSSTTGDIIVTERSPTHQVQIYNQYGQFVRKFGANILQHPRGLTVDSHGRIIVIECKVMRVVIFDQNGNVLHKFGCSKHLRFPNGVVVNDKEEIFISDNRAHCVKVFNYEGRYLRQIGGEGLTNYPIGVCINARGEILIADNHNNFNLTIFTQDGQLISAHESRVKHAQCFDVALIEDNSVVLANKDYRLYVYRYSPALRSGT